MGIPALSGLGIKHCSGTCVPGRNKDIPKEALGPLPLAMETTHPKKLEFLWESHTKGKEKTKVWATVVV